MKVLPVLGVFFAIVIVAAGARECENEKVAVSKGPAPIPPSRPVVIETPIRIVQFAHSGAAYGMRDVFQRRAREQKERAERDAARLAARIAAPAEFEYSLLRDGYDTTVSVLGKDKTILRIVYIFCGRVWIMRLEDAIGRGLREMGFTRLECYDGYDETAWIDL